MKYYKQSSLHSSLLTKYRPLLVIDGALSRRYTFSFEYKFVSVDMEFTYSMPLSRKKNTTYSYQGIIFLSLFISVLIWVLG